MKVNKGQFRDMFGRVRVKYALDAAHVEAWNALREIWPERFFTGKYKEPFTTVSRVLDMMTDLMHAGDPFGAGAAMQRRLEIDMRAYVAKRWPGDVSLNNTLWFVCSRSFLTFQAPLEVPDDMWTLLHRRRL